MFKQTIREIIQEIEYINFELGRMGRSDERYELLEKKRAMLRGIAHLCADYDDGNITGCIPKSAASQVYNRKPLNS